MRFMNVSLPCLLALLVFPAVGLAHLPSLSDGTEVDAAHARVIADPDISQVVYHEVTSGTSRLWLTFTGTAGQKLYAQIGVPVIDRLKDYRPAFAVIGPGLPAATLPFDIPAGLGGVVYTTDAVTPEFFHEPFSGTDSWILREETLTLPADGQYYVVAYVPSQQAGKLWLAVGKREQFGPLEILGLFDLLPRVQAFHETRSAGFPCFLLPVGLAFGAFGVRWLMRDRR